MYSLGISSGEDLGYPLEAGRDALIAKKLHFGDAPAVDIAASLKHSVIVTSTLSYPLFLFIFILSFLSLLCSFIYYLFFYFYFILFLYL